MFRYVNENPYFGVTIGRFSGRISNAEFSLMGKNYKLPENDAPIIGPNNLHGGPKGLSHKVNCLIFPCAASNSYSS